MASTDLIKAVAVTAELCGRTFSPEAAAVFVSDLDGFPEPAVIKALSRCRREVKGMLTIADVVARIDDGRPGVEEAWAMVPLDERTTVVWTDEMAQAFGIAHPLLEAGDKVAARMAFKSAYERMVAQARDERRPPRWTPSLGDVGGRSAPILQAVQLGRISADQALALPMDDCDSRLEIACVMGAVQRLQ
jgi:hypothetical protein